MDKDLMEELGLMATDSQLDYMDTLLDQVGGVLEDYTDTPLEELSKDEASDIIDELKGELGYDWITEEDYSKPDTLQRL